MTTLYGWESRHVPMDGCVQLGRTIATLADWAQALSVPQHQVRSRLKNGDMVIQALRASRESRREVRIRFEHDPGVRAFVRAHHRGATGPEVASFFGVTRARIGQVQQAAVAKLGRRAEPAWEEILGEAAWRQKGAA